MKILKWILSTIGLLTVTYLIGPRVEVEPLEKILPVVPTDLQELENYINSNEAKFNNIKPDNAAQIVWYDSVPKKTKYSIVYLHGFSASQYEGFPVHRDLAKRYGCNLYLPRIAGHGLVEDQPMVELTAKQLIESAKEAVAIGMQLGEQVILLTTSTGGTYGLYLAENNPKIAAIVLYSPNIDLYDGSSEMLDRPWGLQIAKLVKGTDYNEWTLDSISARYWTNKYRLEVLTHLRAMVDATMTKETFEKVTQPVFLGYYYRNDTAQDMTVSVPAMLKMYDQLGTKPELKRKIAFPNAEHHVIACELTSKDVESVKMETIKFLEEIVGVKPVNN
jgi:esterase/lipase